MFKSLLDLSKFPDRKRGLRLLKLAMIYFKSNSNLSKYALEILRLLVHQLCLLSDRGAHEEFFALFVNTTGHYDGHIPADQRMEYLVKEVKEHIKQMASNKTETNIANRTRAIYGVKSISQNFDRECSVLIRAKKHSDRSSADDEKVMLKDLRKKRPFKCQPGRFHEAFPNIKHSIYKDLDVLHYHEWIHSRKGRFFLEKGN